MENVGTPVPDFRAEAQRLIASGKYQSFLEEQFVDFRKENPSLLEFAGEERVRLFIAMALAKGVHYNLGAIREINGLRVMMLHLGSGFDDDPLYPWARFPVFPVKDYTEENPESWQGMLKVWRRFVQFHRESVGHDGSRDTYEYAIKALRRLNDLRFRDIAHLEDDAIVSLFARIYPERYAQLPEEALRGPVLQQAASKAEEYGMPSQAGKAMLFGLFIFCGSSVDVDPLYERIFEGLEQLPAQGMAKEQEFFERLRKYLQYAF